MGFADFSTAREFRDYVRKVAHSVVKTEVPKVQIGKVYSVDPVRQIAWVMLPGQSIDNLIKVRCAADKIPTTVMATTYDTNGVDAPADVVRIWGPPSDKFVLDFYSGTPAPTIKESSGATYLTPEQFGAMGDRVTDDTFAVQLCYDTAAAMPEQSRARVLLIGQYGWTGDLSHGPICVEGTGNPRYTVPVDEDLPGNLIALDKTSRYRYGRMGDGSGSKNDNPGPLRDVCINGNWVGGGDVGEGGSGELFRCEAVDFLLENVHVIRSAPGGITWEVRGSQNGTAFQCLMGYSPGAKALSFYNSPGQGAGMYRFTNCYVASSETLLDTAADPANFSPHDIQFDNCLFEIYVTAMGADMLHLKAGEFQFKSCVFTNSNRASPQPANECLVLIENDIWPTISTTATFDSCYFNGGVCGTTDAVRIKNSNPLTHVANRLHFKGRSHANNFDYLVNVDGGDVIGSGIVTNDSEWYRGTVGKTIAATETTPEYPTNSAFPQGTEIKWIRATNGAYLFNNVGRRHMPLRWEVPDDPSGTQLPTMAVRREDDLGDRFRFGLGVAPDFDAFFTISDGSSGTPPKGTIFYDRANDLMGFGRQVRFANTFGFRTITQFVNTADQAVALSAATTSGPSHLLVFQFNNASAILSMDSSGISGQWLEIYLYNPGITGNSVTWPSNFHFPGDRAPQPVDNSCVVVTMRKIGTDWYGNGDVRNEVIDDRVAALLQEGANVDLTYDDGANQLTIAVPNENIDDRVAALLQEGSGVSIVYDDVANEITISATGSGDEVIDDRVAALIQNGTNITWTYNDAANTLTGQVVLDVDGTLAANSDTVIASQKAVKTYVDRLRVLGTTATGASNAAKVVTIAGYTPASGDVLILTLTGGNTAASPTININAGGAKSVMLGGSAPTAANATTTAGGQWIMRYDGTSWHLTGVMANYSGGSQAAMEAGTGSSFQWMSPLLVKQAIDFHATRKIKAGTSGVTASTADKAVTITGYTLTANDIIEVTLTNGNTSQVPSINVNSTGAVLVQVPGGASFDTTAGNKWLLYYTGTSFLLLSGNDPAAQSVPRTYLDTDVALTANSDLKVATQKAVKAYVDSILDANNAYQYKGGIDCSANPNYPAASAGHTYKVTVAGKIGGASGPNVEIGDSLTCLVDATAAGTHAAVGANWIIIQTNIDGAVVGPVSSVAGNLVSFSGVTGKVIQDSGVSFDTDGTLAANSDTKLATQKAVKTYVDAHINDATAAHAASAIANTPSGKVAGTTVQAAIDELEAEKLPRTPTGTSNTGIGTAAKAVTISGYTLTAGDILAVTLTNGNTSTAPTLNVNAGGAVTIQQTGPTPSFETAAGGLWVLYYTGTVFVLLNTHDPVDAIYANKISSGIDIFARDFVVGEAQMASQRLTICMFTCDKVFTASQIRTVTGATAGSGATTCKVGLFEVNSDSTLTLLAKSANTTSLWIAVNTVYTTAFDAGATVAMERNKRYATAVLQDGGTMPTLLGQRQANGNILTYTPRLVGDYASQTDIPASLAAPSGVGRDRPWAVVLP